MVFITTSRGTDAVQLTSNMISSVLKSSRSICNPVDHFFRRPKQVDFLRRIGAG